MFDKYRARKAHKEAVYDVQVEVEVILYRAINEAVRENPEWRDLARKMVFG